jgi:hypothetical protein
LTGRDRKKSGGGAVRELLGRLRMERKRKQKEGRGGRGLCVFV